MKKNWVMTQAAFDGMLRQLDPDRERAGEKYEQIRQKLGKFFQWRGCTFPEEYTDRTMDRVARRISEGAEILARDPYLYFHGVAINVLREHWKGVERAGVEALEDLPESRNPSEDPIKSREREEDRLDLERRLECLNQCVQNLPPNQLELITQYHQREGGEKIEQRKEMARRMNMPLNALRIRAHRIRGDLENCVVGCLKRAAKA